MKLHLGCGQRYFEGYINIDYPQEHHSVQDKIVADIETDIKTSKYDEKSIAEIRLHHVFEHFTRPEACSILTKWHLWLKEGGILHIEVPDFEKGIKKILKNNGY